MWIRAFLVLCVLLLNNAGTVYALDSSQLKLKILPLECLTDVVDNGLNVYQFEAHPNCGNEPDDTTPKTDQNDTNPENIPSVTYLNNSGLVTNSTVGKSPQTNKLEVAYHAVFNGLHQRQSVLRTIIISVSTLSSLSLIAIILRFL